MLARHCRCPSLAASVFFTQSAVGRKFASCFSPFSVILGLLATATYLSVFDLHMSDKNLSDKLQPLALRQMMGS